MAAVPIYNVFVPYVGAISEGMYPGKIVRIQGNVPPSGNRFSVNLQCGPNTVPRDDIALHISCRFPENMIVRNSLQSMNWGPEENVGYMPLARAQNFEMLVLCDPDHYKIAINGQHFAEFIHRIPYQRVSHLSIDGDITVSMISFEGGSAIGSAFMPPPLPSQGFVGPPHPAPGSMPYPAGAVGPYPPAPYPAAPGPYPPSSSPYPTQPGYGYQQPYGQAYPQSGYPPPPPGYHASHKSGKGGILDKASAAISGVLGPRTGVGLAGAGLGAGLAGAALTGHLSPKKAMKMHKKKHSKALKYGLPLAGAGLGAYALHKGFHHRGSSSSSSSSSSEEE